jgi:hypothetical protein
MRGAPIPEIFAKLYPFDHISWPPPVLMNSVWFNEGVAQFGPSVALLAQTSETTISSSAHARYPCR